MSRKRAFNAQGFDATFRRKAETAIDEFGAALRSTADEEAPAEMERLRNAADGLMQIVARVMIEIE